MFDIADLLIVIILCGLFIFFLFRFKGGKKIENEKNIEPEGDIQQIFYDENTYKSENYDEQINQVEQQTQQSVELELGELGIVSPVDEGDDGFFTYQFNEDEDNNDNDEDNEDIPAPPQTWDDFMGGAQEEAQTPEDLSAHFKGKGKGRSSSIKDMVASVREEIVQKPLSDEEFKKKYFSRLLDEE
jgi:hypothetical protein